MQGRPNFVQFFDYWSFRQNTLVNTLKCYKKFDLSSRCVFFWSFHFTEGNCDISYDKNSNFSFVKVWQQPEAKSGTLCYRWAHAKLVSLAESWDVNKLQNLKKRQYKFSYFQTLTFQSSKYISTFTNHQIEDVIEKTRVSVQEVKSLGGHFACLCRGFEFYEVKKNCYYFSQRKWKYF